MLPFLSICLMTFRRKGTLAETLESLLGQVAEHPEVEVVVCDNASGDGTDEVVKSYQARCPQLRYHLNERNLGFDGNVVICIQQGAGEYIAFFSDDDIAPPGHVEFLLRTLREKRPAVLYFNHAPFLHEDVNHLQTPASPQCDFDSDGGDEYLLRAGLGFISSLVVVRAGALPFLEKVVDGTGGAHLDIASRMALTRSGPCLYRGTYSIYARCNYNSAPILIAGCVNIAKLYHSLVAEGLLAERSYQSWLSDQVWHALPRHVMIARGLREREYPLRGMLDLYGGIPAFYFVVLPLYLIPQPFFSMGYRFGRALLHAWRRQVWKNKTPI